MRVEIWLTDLDVVPDVVFHDEVLKVRITLRDNLEAVLENSVKTVPEVLRGHLINLWAGDCPDRQFQIIDESTVLITRDQSVTS